MAEAQFALLASQDTINTSSYWDEFLRLYLPQFEPAPALWTATLHNLRLYTVGIVISQWTNSSGKTAVQPVPGSSQRLRAHRISTVGPIHLSQQYLSQLVNTHMILHVEGGW